MVRPWTNSESFWPLDRDIIMDNDGWWGISNGTAVVGQTCEQGESERWPLGRDSDANMLMK